MLINLSNHPSDKWTEKQLKQAIDVYGAIEDVVFPAINPNATTDDIEKLAIDYSKLISQKVKDALATNSNEQVAVHVMGEMTFCYAIIHLLKKQGIKCIASTTHRIVVEENNQKISRFEFCMFREYPF